MTQKVGGVEFDVTVDPSGAVSASSKIVSSNKSLENSFEKVDTTLNRLSGSLKEMSAGYSDSSTRLRGFIAEQISAGRSIDENGNVITAYGVKARGLTEEMAKLTGSFKNNESKVKLVDEAYANLTKEAKKLEVSVSEVNEEIRETATVQTRAKETTNALSSASSRASKATSNLSRNIGMGGVQIGQFAGQIQGGQSALLAFSQQGADIGMLFGPAGMIAGGILAVASALAGSLLPALFDSTDKMEDLSEKLKELVKNYTLTKEQVGVLVSEEEKKISVAKKEIDTIQKKIDIENAAIAMQTKAI
jgi:hypothetical protein